MNKALTTSTSVTFNEEIQTQELQLAWRTGEKTNTGVMVYLTPVIDAKVGCSSGTLTGGTTVDEPDEPEYIQWDGTKYQLAKGNVDVEASVFKVFSGSVGVLKVDMDNLEIRSTSSFMGIVKITKNNQSKKYLWKPSDVDEEQSAVVWAYYEQTNSETKKVTKKSAIAQISWPKDTDNDTISLSVGRQDNENDCVYIYQTPNTSAVSRGTDTGSLTTVGSVQNKLKDIFTVWQGTSISLPEGCISCSISVYKVYDGTSGGITVNLTDGVATSENSWNGIVKLSTITTSKKLKWSPSDTSKRTQAVVHAYRKGKISITNVEWVPDETDVQLRLELGQKGSNEGSDVPLKEIKLRLYPALDGIVLGCTVGSIRRGNKIVESRIQYLEFQLVPLPDVHGTDTVTWEPDDSIDSSDVSKVSLGKDLTDVTLEVLDCHSRSGSSVTPSVYYEKTSGNVVGNQSFYGLVKATYKEEFQELLYQQSYSVETGGIMSIKTGYVYARFNEKVVFCEVPWDTNLPSESKELYWVYSYYVRSEYGTFEYPDSWLAELSGEILNFDKKTYQDWETLLESRQIGTFTKDASIQIAPDNSVIEQRVHRTASYDFLGNLSINNAQPIYGSYFKPYTDVKPSPTSTYKPKYFVQFAKKPKLYDGRDEFGEQEYNPKPDFVAPGNLYIPSDASTEELKKAWTGTYLRFNKNSIYQSLLKEFPGLVYIPDEPDDDE